MGDFRPELLAADVLSTTGGVHATLHLRLFPPSGPALVVGHANFEEGSAGHQGRARRPALHPAAVHPPARRLAPVLILVPTVAVVVALFLWLKR